MFNAWYDFIKVFSCIVLAVLRWPSISANFSAAFKWVGSVVGGIPKKKSLAMAVYGQMKSVNTGGLYIIAARKV